MLKVCALLLVNYKSAEKIVLKFEMSVSSKVFYANMCFVCHATIKEKKLKKCSSCKLVLYCSESHQKIHWKYHSPLCRVIQKVDVVLKAKNLENVLNWYKYRTSLLMLSELKSGRKLQPCEVQMILFPNNCQICHKKFDLQPCLDCLCVSYCSEDHKQADIVSHNHICHLFALCLELDLYLEKNYFYPEYSFRNGNFSLLDAIDEFIDTNIIIKNDESNSSKQERALVSELLTCPLSLLFAMTLIKFAFKENVVIHVVGCSFSEIASIKSWETILHINPDIQTLLISFIGPEVMEINDINLCSSCQKKLKFRFCPDLYHDYLKTSCHKNPDVICSFNCGFHEFENSSTDTWAQTLPLMISDKNVPLIFTSFTEREAEKDSNLLLQINAGLRINVLKNKFASLRPHRDPENLGIYFSNGYIAVVLNDSHKKYK